MDYNITYREKNKGIQVIISYKDLGRWKQKSKQGFPNTREGKKKAKIEADKILQTLKVNVNNITYNEFDGITFKEFVIIYLKHLSINLEANTLRTYKNSLKHFNSLFDKKLINIKHIDIQKCIDNLVLNQYSYGTILVYFQKIKRIFSAAINEYDIKMQNPTSKISIDKAKTIKEKIALTPTELNSLLNAIKKPNYYIISLLASKCGLRIGEILGLTWNDIDFTERTLTINKQWKLLKNNTFGFGDLKSKNSNRAIPLTSEMIRELKEFKSSCIFNLDGRIFKYKNTGTLNALINKYFQRRNFNISIHELRHTFATNLIANGVDFKTTARLLGHDIEQTMKTYSHVTDDMLKRASDLMEKFL